MTASVLYTNLRITFATLLDAFILDKLANKIA